MPRSTHNCGEGEQQRYANRFCCFARMASGQPMNRFRDSRVPLYPRLKSLCEKVRQAVKRFSESPLSGSKVRHRVSLYKALKSWADCRVLIVGTFFVVLNYTLISETIAQPREAVRSFRFQNVALNAALDSLLRWYSIPLMYLERDVADKSVAAECNTCTVEEALRQILAQHDLTWKVIGDQVMIEHQPVRSEHQTATLAGSVRDSLTGEWIVGANVFLQEADETIHRWSSTNEFGFFSLRKIKTGSYTLIIRSVGYRTLNEHVNTMPNSASVRDFILAEQNVTLPEITIEGRRSALAASEGISRGVYIRATPSDANQYHLEGARIYNPNHFGGVLSTFNADALRDVQQIAGGVPPFYGGRIGGILDVTLREGMMEQLAGAGSIGTVGSHLMLEGPIADRTSFLISGRRTYPDILLSKNSNGGTPSDLRSAELMAKVSHRLGATSRLFFSGYVGRDAFDNRTSDPTNRQLDNTLRWGNAAANLRWISALSPSLFVHASGVFTRYSFDVEQRLTTNAFSNMFPSTSRLEDIALRAHAEHFYDEFHTFRGGVDLIRHNMSGAISGFATQLASFTWNNATLWELSIYLQDQWRLTPSVLAELGARATSFIGGQGTFSAVDPRFSLLVSLNDVRFYTSLTSINQFLHPYRSSGIFLFYPTIFFYPSTDRMPPTTSLQVSLGMQKSFDESEYTLAAETYYRLTQKLHEFAFDTLATKTLPDVALLGEGTTYGAEFTLTKRAGNFRGSVRYSVSWASNRFAELNDGESYTPRFHRAHELFLNVAFRLSDRWTIGALGMLASNSSPSLTTNSPKSLTVGNPARTLEAASFDGDLNGGRFPGFQRLEFKLLHRFSVWNLPMHASLRLVNGYGLLDPFAFVLRDNPDKRLKWSATFDAAEVFPLYPVVNFGVRF